MSATTPWFIRARLKTRQLMLLTAICDEGNIHRAAEVLNMSQPAASKLLKDLEDMLGVTLFERQPRGMRAELVRRDHDPPRAHRAVVSLREAGQEVDALKTGLSGHVSLGAITGPALSLIPQAIMIIARENPKLRVELNVESSNVLIEQLAQGKLDIMIGRLFERQDKTGLRYERLAEEPVCAVVRPGHPLLNVAGLTLAAVEKKAWIVPPVGQRAAPSLRPDVPRSGARAAGAAHRNRIAAVRHQDAAADGFHLGGAHRSGALLRDLRHGGHPADDTVLHDGRVRHHHAHRLAVVAGGERVVARDQDFGRE